jgi:hypothetical protein
MKAIMAIFGAVLGVMLAWTGVIMSEDIVLEMNAKGQTCVPNPVPIANWFTPNICQDLSGGAQATITGVGWLIFMSLIILLVIGMITVGFAFFFVRSLQPGMPAFASFATMLMVFFIVAFFVIIELKGVFG